MAQITIVGLGPGAPGQLTREAWICLTEISEVWLRTIHHPVVGDLPQTLQLHSFDAVYEQSATFGDVYAHIAETILQLGKKPEGVVYAVPGHPLVGESTVAYILSQANEQQIPVRIIEGLSFIEPALTALSYDALDGLQVMDALDITTCIHPPINPDFPALIAQVYNRKVASNLKLVLMNQYPDEHPVVLVDGAGTTRETISHVPLYAIDREELSPLCTLFLTPLPQVSSFEGFQETIAMLRSPEGCPWDREQTHETLRMNLLEESYEVLEAIDAGNMDALKEELGDLLSQIVLQTQVAVDEGEFQMPDVISAIDAKLKRRHPHVWQGLDVAGVRDVVTNWETIKRQERKENGKADRSLLDGIPKALPALTQAYAYGDRVGRIGFHLEKMSQLLDTVAHDLAALREAEDIHRQAHILGHMLFTLVMWARISQTDPESTLREANMRFAENFRKMERAQQTGEFDQLDDNALYLLWK
ncbi:MAG: nucleoside triphosphate pyrophosphohydrolase [Anaerolineales bacterium]|nr:MAG: nucleoside triphosphate pyrophosphohydrolase [Anaerolineales bacterium]